jgi:FMN-dependent oxidoreductase (nitrilotriacetate monooxygenase family)
MSREMHMCVFMTSTGYHASAWRLPEAEPHRALSLDYFIELAQRCEAAKLDALFFADGAAFMPRPLNPCDPLVLLPALVPVTKNIGLIATASTTYNDPFSLARRFGSLDQLSGGRAGWNVVTSVMVREMENFGLDGLASHADRYERADEFVQVVTELWDSWDDDALVVDQASGVYVDEDRVRTIDHAGKYYRVRGPSTQPRSPQGWPVLVQAGASEQGLAFAARHAEIVFTAQPSFDTCVAFTDDLRPRLVQAGRDPQAVKILPGWVPVMGSTRDEALQRAADLSATVEIEAAVRRMATFFSDIDLSSYPLDEPPPYDLLSTTNAHESRTKIIIDLGQRENLTFGELAKRWALGNGHHVSLGSYEEIADEMQAWFESGACDGFNLQFPAIPGDLVRFTENVVPILQQRGLFRTEYQETTLRDRFGLERPTIKATAGSLGATPA